MPNLRRDLLLVAGMSAFAVLSIAAGTYIAELASDVAELLARMRQAETFLQEQRGQAEQLATEILEVRASIGELGARLE